ncbi:cytochrome b [Asaia krungthepensis]|uniref:Cytochrome B561 n=1 Tax=Asaia krungthepensis NRIC 0535 TaxID=1307925 RepID=A0ABQ0Q1D9_9PROT|nr:cytochrome b/b6 domain-containing protein [Asaia krungthepensis]GBQ86761.1 cytochrome B561 [Asaia krungthepensis NRIC 0535]
MSRPDVFSGPSRLLHWLMVVLILTMLFVGVFMASGAGPHYHMLVSFHRPLGIAILLLAIVRLINRRFNPPPALPADLPRVMSLVAKASHWALYVLMITLPLVGWAMLSAGGYPIPLWGQSLLLPPILPHDATVWGWLRLTHTVLAFGLFGLIMAHAGAALFHFLIRGDRVMQSMTGMPSDPAE